MRLIVNADDFGLTRGINYGILDASVCGIVRSATMMANGNAFDHGVELYKQSDALNLGVHLTLTWGKPVCKDLKTLATEDGTFLHRSILFNEPEKILVDEIRKEFVAQINKIKDAGIKITHLDSHHHAHKVSVVAEIVAELANQMKIPVRPVASIVDILNRENVKIPDNFSQDFYGDVISEDFLIELIKKELIEKQQNKENACLEIMSHPSYIDQDLIDTTAYATKRSLELKVLCSQKVKDFITQQGIKLISYGEL